MYCYKDGRIIGITKQIEYEYELHQLQFIGLVTGQTKCTDEDAADALDKCDNDVVNAIMLIQSGN